MRHRIDMPLSFRSSRFAAVCLAMLASGLACAGELYKWVDENGVVNYSNTPPPKTKGGKPATVIEDRTSVYTPDKSVQEALERARQRPVAPQPPVASASPPGGGVIAAPPPPAPPAAYDPCRVPGDPNCQALIYDGSPVFSGRRRPPPHLVQPQLPPGTIAGQSTASGGIIPGLSGVTPPVPQQPRAPLMRERDRELERHAPRSR
jgi:hypothetical protein